VFLVERFERVNRRIISFHNRVRGTVGPEQKREVAVKRTGFQNITQRTLQQIEARAGLVQTGTAIDEIPMQPIYDIRFAA